MAKTFASFRAKDDADAERHLIACNALVELLLTDPRVERLHKDWLRETGLRTLARRVRVAKTPAIRDARQAEFAWSYGIALNVLALVLSGFVTKELRLPYPNLALQLAMHFATAIANEAAASDLVPVTLVFPPRGTPRGRRAKGGGESIRRNVEWFYRLHVQQPPETMAQLTKEYSKQANRRTAAHSVVQNGIIRAKALLDAAEFVFQTPPK